ncbi:MAG TPA: hypothetical protein VNV65_04395 [Candidatus Solibacter sp.]|jgi:hypothetical protein|nr:hypothetical protein [Candidatus Solibacter sp.]
MIRETLYTSIGAAALAVDFVTSPQKQINWLKKAERRGSRLAKTSQAQVRPVTKQVESAIEELRVTSLSALGLAERRAEKAEAKVKATVRRSTPKARVSRRRRTTGGRKVRQTTLTLQTPAAKAS